MEHNGKEEANEIFFDLFEPQRQTFEDSMHSDGHNHNERIPERPGVFFLLDLNLIKVIFALKFVDYIIRALVSVSIRVISSSTEVWLSMIVRAVISTP